jgi:hypothetical protein
MRTLFTGKGGASGSWAVRGQQLGAAIGATVKPLATHAEIAAHDLTVVVKRTPQSIVDALKFRRWVWDIVDAYPQPEASAWTRREAVAWVRDRIRTLQPSAVIWPTQRMREDCDIDIRNMVLPHHYRPGIERNPIREKVRTVGYEGRADYLDQWALRLSDECERRGWSFVVNPKALADLDIVVAFRGGKWDGYVQRHWKSAVKLANAHGSGTPFVGQVESGYEEMATGAEYWAEDIQGVRTAFDWLESQSAREQVADRFVQGAYSLKQAASDLGAFLARL